MNIDTTTAKSTPETAIGYIPYYRQYGINVLSFFDGILFGIDCGISYICAWKN